MNDDLNDLLNKLDNWLDSLSVFSMRLVLISGIGLWIIIVTMLGYSLFSDKAIAGYTYHGHPITVEELKEYDDSD